ncbi:hypothetical protein [Paludisphaera rhizosphaerae]|uniref:hypothetical protein n=1 Tax=Paludisphaera rhizosphaerae TaxID=2711216 RepID=UPI0013EDA927|nr:hypothetical protein [Paludisphaera rhizosphaerae]
MNPLMWLVRLPGRGGSDVPASDAFSKLVPRGTAKYRISADEIINDLIIQYKLGLSNSFGPGARILVVAVDPTKAASWAGDLEEVLSGAASFAGKAPEREQRAITFRSNDVASAYLVPIDIAPYSVRQFIICTDYDINDGMRERVEKDLRKAIDDGFPSLPDRPKLTPEEVDVRIKQAEQRFAEIRRLQLEELEQLLIALEGTSKGNYTGNRVDAVQITSLVEEAEAVLLFTGEGRKGRHYSNQPCTIRCEHEGVSSFKLRTADKAAVYIASLPSWPRFQVISKKDVKEFLTDITANQQIG